MQILKKALILIVLSISVYIVVIETILLIRVNSTAEKYKTMYQLSSDYISIGKTQNYIATEILKDIENFEIMLNEYTETGNEKIKAALINTHERHESMVADLQVKYSTLHKNKENKIDSILPKYKAQFQRDFKLIKANTNNLINYIVVFTTANNTEIISSVDHKSPTYIYFSECKKNSRDLIDKYTYERTYYFKEYNSVDEKRSIAFKNLLLALIPFLVFGLPWLLVKKEKKANRDTQ